MSELNTPEDAMPLLAYKIAPRQFDLSYRFSNISLRDQIVRAQMLIRTLVETKLVKTEPNDANANNNSRTFQLLICGAGAAGLSAAKEADAHNISFVLVEKGRSVPGGVLRSKALRYVSTAMYEWPHPNHREHTYPLSEPALLGDDVPPRPTLPLTFDTPVLIKKFGDELRNKLKTDIRQWRSNFAAFQATGLPTKRSLLTTNANISEDSKNALKDLLKESDSVHGATLTDTELPEIEIHAHSDLTIAAPYKFSYVIYAVGFSKESKTYDGKRHPYRGFKHTPFWQPDNIFEDKIRFGFPPRVGILGSGDGALQDALRCLIKKNYQHPLDIWNGLMQCEQADNVPLENSIHVREAMAKVAAADGYTTGGAIWHHETNLFQSLDNAFEKIASILINSEGVKLRHALSLMARDDVKSVTIVRLRTYFSKAYALNRFLVILLRQLMKDPDYNNGPTLEFIDGKVTEFRKLDSHSRGGHLVINSAADVTTQRDFDLVLIRGGLDRTNPTLQFVGLKDKDTGRVGLGRIPPPIRPVASAT
ncbi:NAD(P)-binding protein [Burkholderia sp. AU15512]|uniref:NAD(P)-binding protein n=1 Tax=Burkholderia sp. AU15512 TaxID=2015345 RepID=UPI00117EEF24|nr:NAD(P)-binding protein [Burkholderia sp. AU15512]